MPPEFIRNLGNDLIMRRACPEDADALSNFNAVVHSDDGPEEPDEGVRAWVQDLLERPHPTFQPGDFTIVEDTNTKKIVSSLNLISQTWSYEGIEFGVGRPELVGTAPEYRNRGLVRAQFEAVHEWSAKRGHQVQAITGIPYYYRLFGYEMAMDLGGGRLGFKRYIPKLKEGEVEPFRIRLAVKEDIPFLANLDYQSSQRYLVHCVRNEALWLNDINGKSPKNVNRRVLLIIESVVGQPVGYFGHPPNLRNPGLVATQYELKEGVSWSQVTPTVIRYLFTTGKQMINEAKKPIEVDGYGFWLGREHPVYTVLHDDLPRVRKPYAWYLRVTNVVEFLHHITPVLEKHLAQSPFQGYTGDLKITFYRTGLIIGIENGRLTKIESYVPSPVGHSGDAAFPGLTFYQLLFGYRSLDELAYAFADCWYEKEEIFGVLSALFPKKSSNLWPIA